MDITEKIGNLVGYIISLGIGIVVLMIIFWAFLVVYNGIKIQLGV